MRIICIALIFLGSLSLWSEEKDHILQVTGSGMVSIKATIADVRLSIEIEGKNSQSLQSDLAKRTNQLLDALQHENIDHLESTSFSVFPEYSNTSPPEIRGYRGKAEVKVSSKIEEMGSIIAHAMDAGASGIHSIDLRASPSEIETARNEALSKACAQCLSSSKAVLDALGLEQKGIVSVVVQPSGFYPTPFKTNVAAMAFKSAEVQLEGEQEIHAEVLLNIRFSERH